MLCIECRHGIFRYDECVKPLVTGHSAGQAGKGVKFSQSNILWNEILAMTCHTEHENGLEKDHPLLGQLIYSSALKWAKPEDQNSRKNVKSYTSKTSLVGLIW